MFGSDDLVMFSHSTTYLMTEKVVFVARFPGVKRSLICSKSRQGIVGSNEGCCLKSEFLKRHTVLTQFELFSKRAKEFEFELNSLSFLVSPFHSSIRVRVLRNS